MLLALCLRPCRFHFGRRVEVFEILCEAVAQVFRGFVVGGFVGPGVAWIEHLRRHAVDRSFGMAKPKVGSISNSSWISSPSTAASTMARV